jgi:hypothetical protein
MWCLAAMLPEYDPPIPSQQAHLECVPHIHILGTVPVGTRHV